jgi:hypothetical protein
MSQLRSHIRSAAGGGVPIGEVRPLRKIAKCLLHPVVKGQLIFMRNETRHLPARLLTPDERALVAEWFETTGDVASAHVSSRRSDDPDFLHRVLVVTGPDDPARHPQDQRVPLRRVQGEPSPLRPDQQ